MNLLRKTDRFLTIVSLFQGETFPNKYVAKKSAFMEVVKRLWAAGVLDPSTLRPISRHSITNFRCEFLDQLDKELEKTSPEKSKPVGSKNHFVWYPKQVEFHWFIKNSGLSVPYLFLGVATFTLWFWELKGLQDTHQFGGISRRWRDQEVIRLLPTKLRIWDCFFCRFGQSI